MAGDVMYAIKDISRDMSEQVKLNRKQEIHQKAENVLSKIQSKADSKNKKDSILDLDLLKINTNLKTKTVEEDDNKSLNQRVNNILGLEQESMNSNKFSRENDSKNLKNRGFYEKQLEYLSQHELKMNHLRKEKMEREKETLKHKPNISENSKKMVSKKSRFSSSMTDMNRAGGNQDLKKLRKQTTGENEHDVSGVKADIEISNTEKPFYLRSQEIYQEQEERKEKLRKMYEMIERTKDERLNPNNVVVKPYEPESFEKWRKDKIQWKQRKEERVIKIKKDIVNKELNEQFAFAPELDSNSQKIVQEKYNNTGFYERSDFYKENKGINAKKIKSEMVPQFTPSLNKDLPGYIRKEKIEEFKLNKSNSTAMLAREDSPNIAMASFDRVDSPRKNQEDSRREERQTHVNKVMSSHNTEFKDTGNFYNLNIRDNSVWNENKENFVVLNSVKYSDIMGKLVDNGKDSPSRSSQQKKARLSINAWK
eukprot:CAMPEP_0170519592 /NCGR_PEP_ID=MMETSP0209-20121228/4956_1 /TAXON_ID=665100 ORGANISM="Litonotus pictus, Strain P1" /NCGR_SAMPLE_ID=MMETSP0209 /ASSEMBLY_ACC=CAM_ASM_000301 /LENGTH=480 /DNA_ID=CAMNT_0010805523 /DNA_START=35 /DNA_END=1477 /DNA_ORIENTATION=+